MLPDCWKLRFLVSYKCGNHASYKVIGSKFSIWDPEQPPQMPGFVEQDQQYQGFVLGSEPYLRPLVHCGWLGTRREEEVSCFGSFPNQSEFEVGRGWCMRDASLSASGLLNKVMIAIYVSAWVNPCPGLVDVFEASRQQNIVSLIMDLPFWCVPHCCPWLFEGGECKVLAQASLWLCTNSRSLIQYNFIDP